MRISEADPFRLQVLGAPDLRGPDGRRVTSVLSQPKRLGLLTYLALAEAPVSRGTLVALFWPESEEARARNALSQAVFHLRRSLDERVVQNVEGDRLWASPSYLWCDAREVLAWDPSSSEGAELAERAGRGDLLEGWNASDSQELQEWLDGLRRRLSARAAELAAAPPPPAAAEAPPAPADGPAGASPPAGRGTPAQRAPGGASRRSRLLAGVAAAILAASLLAVALQRDPAPAAADAEVGSLAVLLPHITSAPGAPHLDPSAVLAEILTTLPHVDGVRIVSAGYAASLQDLRRQLDALGVEAGELPRWILEVSVRVTDHEARAIGLLHRSPGYDLPGRVSFDVSYASPEAALLEAPQEIASGVSAMVAEVLAAGGR